MTVSVTQQPRRLDARTPERTQSQPIIGRSHTNTIVGMDERTDEDDDEDVGDAETVPELIEGDIAVDQVSRYVVKKTVCKNTSNCQKTFCGF